MAKHANTAVCQIVITNLMVASAAIILFLALPSELVGVGRQAFAWLTHELVAITGVLASFADGSARRPGEAAARAEEGRGGANMKLTAWASEMADVAAYPVPLCECGVSRQRGLVTR